MTTIKARTVFSVALLGVARMVQKLKRANLSGFSIVETEHTAKTLFVSNRIIR